jgi:hypothetical protein
MTFMNRFGGFVLGLSFIFGSLSGKADFFYGNTINQDSSDITVVSAQYGKRVAFSLNPKDASSYDLFLDRCSKLPRGMGFLFDCTEDLVSKTALPALMSVVLREGTGFNCGLLTVKTVTRADAYAVASGIGFYSVSDRVFGMKNESRLVPVKQTLFVPMKNLVELKGVFTLKNGEKAIQNIFVGLGGCQQGDASLTKQWPVEFKPYLQIDAPEEGRDGTRYLNWDLHLNYKVSLDNQLERSSEVLK